MCVFVWVAGTALCNMERYCDCRGDERAGASDSQSTHDHDIAAVDEQGRSHDAGHHHDDPKGHKREMASHCHDDGTTQVGHDCKGKNCDNENRCCSTIQALVVTLTPIVIAKPVSQTALLISLLCAAREHMPTTASTKALRQAKPREWVFTPEVSLGPALHSLAPPASV